MTDVGKREAQFMGRITAGVTHEMKNVLAIIRESVGLMQDILSATKDPLSPIREKFSRTLANVQQQVDRGVDISVRLNKFAHSADEVVTGMDLNQTVDQIVSLSQRFAKVKGISLRAMTQDTPIIVVNDPLKMHMLIFQCLEVLLDLLQPGSVLGIEPKVNPGNGISLSFQLIEDESPTTGSLTSPTQSPHWSGLEELAVHMGGTVTSQASSGLVSLAFKE